MTKIVKPKKADKKPKSSRRGRGWGEGSAPEEQELEFKGSIEDELREDGIQPFSNTNVNDEFLQLPRLISDATAKQLGEYLNTFTQQKMWTRTLLGRTASMLKDYNSQLDRIRGSIYAELPVKMAVKEKEIRVKTHPDAQTIVENLNHYDEKYSILKDYFENLEDGIFNISREISRRGNDFNDESRAENVGRR